MFGVAGNGGHGASVGQLGGVVMSTVVAVGAGYCVYTGVGVLNGD